uniref:Uncharacterized protein n=1 Tax=Arundo donax TaxID=35708 RepID=A0A0A9E9H3_ARUDO
MGALAAGAFALVRPTSYI